MFLGSLLWAEDHKEFSDFIECSKRKEIMKPWDVSCDRSFSVCCWSTAFNICLVFLYESYWTFILQLVLFHKGLMLSLSEDLRELRKTVWHCMNLTDGSWRFRPNWLQGRLIPLKVALIGRSNHWRMNRIVMESRFSITHVLARLATVRCQESFESTYLWYKSNYFSVELKGYQY